MVKENQNNKYIIYTLNYNYFHCVTITYFDEVNPLVIWMNFIAKELTMFFFYFMNI